MAKLIEDYLKDLTAFDITDGAIENVLIQAHVIPGSTVESLTVKQRELCMGYTYLWCATTPTISGSVEDADSGWSHREGGKQTSAYDKRLLRQMGLDLLAKYGINPIKSTIHVVPRGMRVFPRHK
jgi:hypothetical protein